MLVFTARYFLKNHCVLQFTRYYYRFTSTMIRKRLWNRPNYIFQSTSAKNRYFQKKFLFTFAYELAQTANRTLIASSVSQPTYSIGRYIITIIQSVFVINFVYFLRKPRDIRFSVCSLCKKKRTFFQTTGYFFVGIMVPK